MSTPLERVRKALEPLQRLYNAAIETSAMDRGHAVSFIGSLTPDELRAADAALAALREMEEQEVVAWAAITTDICGGGFMIGPGDRLVAYLSKELCEDLWPPPMFTVVPLVRAHKEGE